MARVILEEISKVYPDGTRAVSDFSVYIDDGEFVVLVGPSGCGKSTALRMVAGLEEISSGTLRIGDRVVNDVPAKDRDIAMVFQNYALYPHMSVADNIGFALKLRKLPKAEIIERVRHAAEILELGEFLGRKPGQLSGGQRQRVAMGRAIVRQPSAFLMDEPLSNLDAKLRVQMRAEIARIQKDLGVTTLYVTHDQVEAMTMGDRVAVMRKGILQQVDPPQVLYDRPNNLFVAGFIGSPAMNIVMARIEKADGGSWLHLGTQRLRLDEKVFTERPALDANVGRDVAVGIRPEDMEDAVLEPDHPQDRRMRSSVDLTEALGSEVIVHFTIDAPPVVTDQTQELAEDAGSPSTGGQRRSTSGFVAKFSPRTAVRKGDEVEIAVDTARFHFFDPATNQAIRD